MKKKFFFCIVLTYSYVEPYSKVGCISEKQRKRTFLLVFHTICTTFATTNLKWKRRQNDIILLGCCWRCSCQCLCCRLCMYTLKRIMRRIIVRSVCIICHMRGTSAVRRSVRLIVCCASFLRCLSWLRQQLSLQQRILYILPLIV